MGAYILRCTASQATQIWGDWCVSASPSRLYHRRAKLTEDSSINGVLLSFEVKPTIRLRALAVGVLLLAISLFFAFNGAFVSPVMRGFPKTSPVFYVPVSTAFNCLSFLSPYLILLSLGLLHSLLSREDSSLRRFVESQDVDVETVTPRQQWAFFPLDAVVLQVIFSLLLYGVSAFYLRNGDLPIMIGPQIVVIVSYLLLILIGEVADRKLLAARSEFMLWRLRAAQLTFWVSIPFLFILISYSGLTVYQHAGLALRYAYQQETVPTADAGAKEKVQAVYDFDLGTFLVGKNAAAFRDDSQVALDYAQGEIPNTRYIPLSLAFLMAIAGLMPPLLTARSARKWRREWGAPVYFAPKAGVRQRMRLSATLVWLHWFVLAIGNVLSCLIALLALQWMFGITLLPGSLQWQTPFIWYGAAWVNMVGESGAFLARITLLVMLAPALCWIAIWAVNGSRIVSAAWSRRYPATDSRWASVLAELCPKIGMTIPPLVREEGRLIWPTAMPGVLFFRPASIHYSPAITDRLTDPQLRIIAAHEIAHLKLHTTKIRILQFLSTISLAGPGYLTLLVDYWDMEEKADALAVKMTGDSSAIEEVLVASQQIELAAIAEGGRTSTLSRGPSRGSVLNSIRRILWPYQFYLDSPLWGYSRPSPLERLTALHVQGSASSTSPPRALTSTSATRLVEPKRKPITVVEYGSPAGLRSRLAAYGLDAFVIFVPILILASISSAMRVPNDSPLAVAGGFYTLLSPWAYFASLWRLFGKTLGSRLAGIKVVSRDGGRVSTMTAVWRAFVVCIELPTLIGLLMVPFTKTRREFADVVTNSRVINVKKTEWAEDAEQQISGVFDATPAPPQTRP
jgi:uncharacterized RDD family membrane protein YckC/Zn-dependent protease with chaperone function